MYLRAWIRGKVHWLLRRPLVFVSCDVCGVAVREDQIVVDQYDNVTCGGHNAEG
jgi:hypothetical protein